MFAVGLGSTNPTNPRNCLTPVPSRLYISPLTNAVILIPSVMGESRPGSQRKADIAGQEIKALTTLTFARAVLTPKPSENRPPHFPSRPPTQTITVPTQPSSAFSGRIPDLTSLASIGPSILADKTPAEQSDQTPDALKATGGMAVKYLSTPWGSLLLVTAALFGCSTTMSAQSSASINRTVESTTQPVMYSATGLRILAMTDYGKPASSEYCTAWARLSAAVTRAPGTEDAEHAAHVLNRFFGGSNPRWVAVVLSVPPLMPGNSSECSPRN